MKNVEFDCFFAAVFENHNVFCCEFVEIDGPGVLVAVIISAGS